MAFGYMSDEELERMVEGFKNRANTPDEFYELANSAELLENIDTIITGEELDGIIRSWANGRYGSWRNVRNLVVNIDPSYPYNVFYFDHVTAEMVTIDEIADEIINNY